MYAYRHNPDTCYTPQPFARFGLAVLTAVIVSSALGMYFLIFGRVADSMTGLGILFLLAGVIVYVTLEFFVQGKKHRLSGVDDALLIFAIGYIASGLAILDDMHDPSILWLTAGLLCSLAVLRFADRVVAVAGLGCFLFAILAEHRGVPNVLAAAALALAVNVLSYRGVPRAHPYEGCLRVLRYASLLALYTCLNVFFLDSVGSGAPPRWFWIPTLALPPVYLAVGLVRRARPALQVGLVAAVLAVLTYRHYHPILPLAEAMTLAGAFLILLSWGLIRYLKTPRSGFTSEPEGEPLLSGAEVLAVTQVFGAKTTTPRDDRSFGGGSFGGGGAGGDF